MELTFFITSLSLIPYFTSRAAIPVLATALTARFGTEWAPVAELAGIQLLDDLPGWAISDTALMILALVALAELILNKTPESRELYALGDAPAKGVTACLICLAIAGVALPGLPSEDVSGSQIARQAGLLGELSLAHLWALVIGMATWFAASLRNGIYGFLLEVDADDDLGLQKLLSWMEDGIGFLGVLFAVILPVVALVVAGVTLLGLYLVRRYLEYREEKAKPSCPSCDTPRAPCGIECPSCGDRELRPRQVGWLGTIREATTEDLVDHRFQLRAQKRCPRCGERLPGKHLEQTCTACGTRPFETVRELEAYLQRMQPNLWKTLGILLVLGAVPVVGLIPGVLYYRLTLISSLRHYVPRSNRMVGRWVVRILNLVLLCLQPIPIFGAFMLPAMGLTNYWVYRGLLRRQGKLRLAAGPTAVET